MIAQVLKFMTHINNPRLIDPNDYKISPLSRKLKQGNYWALAQIRYDKKIGGQYIDLLYGNMNKAIHGHAGFKFDGTFLFNETRGIVNKISREVLSKNSGLMDKRDLLFNNSKQSKATISIVAKIDDQNKEIIISNFKIDAI